MLRGNWRYIATFGLALFVGYFVFADLNSVSQSFEQQASERSEIYEQNAEYEIRQRCRALVPAAQMQCIAETEQAARENQRVEQDLAAQKITAWWTKVMGVAALIGMGLSAVGVFLVYTTFHETRKANEFTEQMMKDADTASIPFLEISPYAFIGGPSSHCRVTLCNHGPSIIPTYEVSIEMVMEYVGTIPLERVVAAREQSLAVLKPEQQQYTPLQYDFIEVQTWENKKMTLRAFGYFTDSKGRKFAINRRFVAFATLECGDLSGVINTAFFCFGPDQDE